MAAKPSFSNNTTNNKFVDGHNLGRGRPRGVRNKTTRIMRDAILIAAESLGEDGEGLDGLVGFLRESAQLERAAYLSLMAKLIPLQVVGSGGGPLRIETNGMSLQERQQQFAEDLKAMRLGQMPPRLIQLIEHRAEEKKAAADDVGGDDEAA